MKFKKNYAAAIIIAVVIINIAATFRLLFAVAYPERVLKERVTDYFKANFEKAIKFEEIYIDSFGDIILTYFNVSATSDFNDNISLIRSNKTKLKLGFFGLFTGRVRVKGVDFYDSDITLIKKYGRSHREFFLTLIDPERIIAKVKSSGDELQIRLHGSRILYRESLRDRQVSLEMYKVGAELDIEKDSVSYSATGKIKPYKTERIFRRGSFDCRGTVDLRAGGPWEHRVEVDNFDLTYLNDHIAEYKLAGVLLKGGISLDLTIADKKGVLYVAGRMETSSLTATSLEHKYDLVSGENLDIDLDMTFNSRLNRYIVRTLSIKDGVIALEASGMYVKNDSDDAVQLKFKTNSIDLSDLSQNLTPIKNIEYGGRLQCDGAFSVDFKKNTTGDIRAGVLLDDFTVSKNEKGSTTALVGKTSMQARVGGNSIDVAIKGRPLNSDVAITSKTKIETWVPLRTETAISLKSKRMNVDNIRLAVLYLANRIYESAYDDKRGGMEKIPFLQRPLGKFLSTNSIDFTGTIDTVFYGKRAGLKNLSLGMQLSRGAATISGFSVEGYGGKYALSGQGYFNSDQPYIKFAGKVDDFDLGRFYTDSGVGGSISGAARADFSYEVSISRIGDILDNARGSLNVRVGRGEMRNTRFQRELMAYLAKIGHDSPSIAEVNFEDIAISMTETGENFWISNMGIRGDTLLFNVATDYLFEGGLDTRFGMVIRKDAGMVTVPLRLHGPLLAPCLDASNGKDAPRLCF